MSILPVGGVMPSALLEQMGGVAGAAGLTGPQATPGSGAAFGVDLAGSIDQLQAMQSSSEALGIQAVTGDLDDIHDYTIASSQAAVTLELTAALRNKAVDAFTEIMRMQA